MDARWEEGIGRTSHMLELQELGGFVRTGFPIDCVRKTTLSADATRAKQQISVV